MFSHVGSGGQGLCSAMQVVGGGGGQVLCSALQVVGGGGDCVQPYR